MSLFTPEILKKFNHITVNYGHEIVGMKPDEKLNASCDSFVFETDVHYPTDTNLLEGSGVWTVTGDCCLHSNCFIPKC